MSHDLQLVGYAVYIKQQAEKQASNRASLAVNAANEALMNSPNTPKNNGTLIELYGAAGSKKLPTKTEETGEENND